MPGAPHAVSNRFRLKNCSHRASLIFHSPPPSCMLGRIGAYQYHLQILLGESITGPMPMRKGEWDPCQFADWKLIFKMASA